MGTPHFPTLASPQNSAGWRNLRRVAVCPSCVSAFASTTVTHFVPIPSPVRTLFVWSVFQAIAATASGAPPRASPRRGGRAATCGPLTSSSGSTRRRRARGTSRSFSTRRVRGGAAAGERGSGNSEQRAGVEGKAWRTDDALRMLCVFFRVLAAAVLAHPLVPHARREHLQARALLQHPHYLRCASSCPAWC